MAELLSLRAYARHRGVSLQAVQRALESKRIKTVTDERGRERIDPDLADADWAKNSNPAMQRKPAVDVEGNPSENFAESRAEKEKYLAKLAKLEYREKSRKLVKADEIRRTWESIITTTKTKLLAVPSKAKSQLPHLTLADIALLEELIREALKEISECEP